MSTLFGFVVGYVVGARAGSDGFERLERAFQDIRQSDEFRNFLRLLRTHAVGTVQVVSDRLKDDDATVAGDLDRLVAQARARLSNDDA